MGNEGELTSYIKQRLSMGVSFSEIKSNLKQDPEYDEELLDKSIEKLILTNANCIIDNKSGNISQNNSPTQRPEQESLNQETNENVGDNSQTNLENIPSKPEFVDPNLSPFERLLKNQMFFAVVLLVLASLILLISLFTTNPKASKLPILISIVMLVAAFVIYIGPSNIKEYMEEMKENKKKQKERKY
ncbi:MAG: hypothetical protein KC589_09630 [Nanoarchaeota archaeon]|nr:hypothetical protein [Nanoarchaeota archaeon]